jgi:tripartite ATP-independent transporter DctM subunit
METFTLYLGIFGVLFVLGIPIVLALALAAIIMLLLNDVPLLVFAQKFIVSLDNFNLTAMFFFIFAGELMNGGGMTHRIVGAVSRVVKGIPGGLAIVAVLSCALFAAINGSAIATTIAIAAILYSPMVKQGYPPAFAAAVIAAGGVIGPIIPPSIPMIVYGSITGDSIAALFSGGFILGLLVTLGEIAVVYLVCRARGYGAGAATLELGENKGAIWAIMFPVLIFGVIIGGLMTATEAAAFAVMYAWFVGAFVFREFRWKDLPMMVHRAMKGSGMIMAIVGSATAVAWVLTYQRVPQQVTEAMVENVSNPMMFMAVAFAILFFVGMIMDLTPAILILTPIFMGPVASFGIDPVYFGVFFCSVLTAGLITPPVGTLIYLGCATSKSTLGQVVRQLLPLIAVVYGVLFLSVKWPGIITYIPRTLLNM